MSQEQVHPDRDIEHRLLGALVANPGRIPDAASTVSASMFSDPDAAAVWRVLLAMLQQGRPIDMISVPEVLASDPKLRQAGVPVMVLHWHDTVIRDGSLDVERLAAYVRRRGRLRMLRHDLLVAKDRVEGPDVDPAELAGEFVSQMLRYTSDGDDRVELTFSDLVGEAIQDVDDRGSGRKEQGLSTGLADLDRLLGGLQAGRSYVIAARPGMGKSVMAAHLVRAACPEDKRVGVFSLEMPAKEWTDRILVAEGCLPADRYRSGQLDATEWGVLLDVGDIVRRWPLRIDDRAGLTLGQIRAKAQRWHLQGGLDLVIIDYLQLVRLRGSNKREEAVAEISRSLKQLARDLKIPVVVLAQLNRAVEARADKRPLMSDLRESGAVEQDADVIAMLYRDAYYEPETGDPDVLEVLVRKQRGGDTGTVRVRWLGHHLRLEGLEDLL